MEKLVCGTRGSELALTQTNLMLKEISKHSDVNFEIKKIKTSGDKRQTRERISSDDKKDWIIELEEQLLSCSALGGSQPPHFRLPPSLQLQDQAEFVRSNTANHRRSQPGCKAPLELVPLG